MVHGSSYQAVLDDQFKAVAHVERRRVLTELAALDAPSQQSVTIDALGPLDRSRTVALYHRHLPHLADCGYVDWHRETGEVLRGPQFGEIEPLITVLTSNADRLCGEVA